MEYKYRFLNPPTSTASIDFKLSETHLDTYTFLSPSKPKDSLTYTISMQTIQDEDCKSPNLFQNLPSVMELEHMECRESMKPEEDERICNFVSLARIDSEKLEEEFNEEELLDKIEPSILKLVQCKDQADFEIKQLEISQRIRSKSERQDVNYGIIRFSKQKNIRNQNQKESFVAEVKNDEKQRPTSKYLDKYGCFQGKINHNFSKINEILKVKGYESNGKGSFEYKSQIEKRNSLIKTSSSSYVNSPDFRKQKQSSRQAKCLPMRPSSPQIGNQKFGIQCYAMNRKQIKSVCKNRKRIFSDLTFNKTVYLNSQVETAKNRSRYGSVHDSSAKSNSNAPSCKIDCLSVIAVKMNLGQRQRTNGRNTKRGKEHVENANQQEKSDILDKHLQLSFEKINKNEETKVKRLVKAKFEQRQKIKSMSLHA